MRYTHYDEHKKRWQINDDHGAVMIDELNYAVGEAVDKLAAYEDTGLTPEEFKESAEFVLELNKKLKPYMDAEEQGLLVRLPCKVGDTFFFLSETIHGELYVAQSRVSNIVIAGDALMIVDSDGCYHYTYWFTREEAEATLKGESKDV